MAFLQLAEKDYTMLAAANPDKYVFIPEGFRGAEKDTYIREDLFDDLPEDMYNTLMNELDRFNTVGLSDKASRKARREERKKLKASKQAGRGAAARREARQKRVETRAAAREKTGGLAGLIGKVGDVVGNITGAGNKSADFSADFSGSFDTGGEAEPTFFEKYRTPLILGGVAVGGFILYKVMKNK